MSIARGVCRRFVSSLHSGPSPWSRLPWPLRALAALIPFFTPLPTARADDYVLLTILHTNDVHGRVVTGANLEDTRRGGLARVASMVTGIRAQMPNVLLFDSGDCLHGTPVEYSSQGQAIIAAMNTLGYDAATYGNHEFDWGQEAALKAVSQATFPYVSTNVVDGATGKPWGLARRYMIKEVEGLRIALFGLTTLETVALEWPPLISNVRLDDPLQAARELVPQLRQQADIVICLSHLGYKADLAMAAAVPGIDIILGGHSHDAIRERTVVGKTLIAQAGTAAEVLGRIDLIATRKDQGPFRIRSINGVDRWWNRLAFPPLNLVFPETTLIPVGPDITQAPRTLSAYEPFEKKAQQERDQVAARVPALVSASGGPGDTPLAGLYAEAYRAEFGTDLGISEGKMQGQLPAGDTTVGQLWDLLGGYTGQNLLKIEVTGRQLRDALDQLAGLPTGLAIGASGLSASLDPSRPAGQRVTSLEVRGQPVLDTQKLTLAGVMYVLRRFPPLLAGLVLSDNLGWTRQAIAAYARHTKVLEPPKAPSLLIQTPAAPVTPRTGG
ncbi:MAG TPA: bifunctional UDP-sugar hydrolase/5'-nucleotidase [Armatimonadota bacterium]